MFKIEFTGETIEDLKAKVKDLTMLFYPLPSATTDPCDNRLVIPTPSIALAKTAGDIVVNKTPVVVDRIDRDEVKKRVAEIVKVKGNTKLKAILSEFGAAKGKDVPDEKLPELLQRMEAA